MYVVGGSLSGAPQTQVTQVTLPREAAQNSHQARPSVWFCWRGDWQVGGLSWPPDVRPLGRSLPSPAAAERGARRGWVLLGPRPGLPANPQEMGLSPWKNGQTWGSRL